MFSSKYLLAFVLVVTGLSVFSVPTGANALVLPSHAHARRAAALLNTPDRRRATRMLKRRLSADVDEHTFARRGATPPATPSDADDDDAQTPASGKQPPGAQGNTSSKGGVLNTVIDTAGNSMSAVADASVHVVSKTSDAAVWGVKQVAGAGKWIGGTLYDSAKGTVQMVKDGTSHVVELVSPSTYTKTVDTSLQP
jgi:hypothetical protein